MARQPRVPGAAEANEAYTEQAKPLAEAPEADLAPTATQLRAADVDPSKLRRAVLTADGWVCPERSPAPPTRE